MAYSTSLYILSKLKLHSCKCYIQIFEQFHKYIADKKYTQACQISYRSISYIYHVYNLPISNSLQYFILITQIIY